MNIITTLIIGGLVHALLGAGVFFAEREPYKVQIFMATIIKGFLVSLLIVFSLKTPRGSWIGALYGLLYGFAFGLIVFLAKGASFQTAPYLLGISMVQGLLTGLLVAKFAFRSL